MNFIRSELMANKEIKLYEDLCGEVEKKLNKEINVFKEAVAKMENLLSLMKIEYKKIRSKAIKRKKIYRSRLSFQRNDLKKLLNEEKGNLDLLRKLRRAQKAHKAFTDKVGMYGQFDEKYKKEQKKVAHALRDAEINYKKFYKNILPEIKSLKNNIKKNENKEKKALEKLKTAKGFDETIHNKANALEQYKKELSGKTQELKGNRVKGIIGQARLGQARLKKLTDLKSDLDKFVNKYTKGLKALNITNIYLKISNIMVGGLGKIVPTQIRADVERLKTAMEIQKNCEIALDHVNHMIKKKKADPHVAVKQAMKILSAATIDSQRKLNAALETICPNKEFKELDKLSAILKSKEHTLRKTFGMKP